MWGGEKKKRKRIQKAKAMIYWHNDISIWSQFRKVFSRLGNYVEKKRKKHFPSKTRQKKVGILFVLKKKIPANQTEPQVGFIKLCGIYYIIKPTSSIN